MDLKTAVRNINTNRFMRSEVEIQQFEIALEEVMKRGDYFLIDDLCLCFDDDTEHHEVLFGLVHTIEHLYSKNEEKGLQRMAISVPNMLAKSNEWAKILHYRILNNPQIRLSYRKVIEQLEKPVKDTICNFLLVIKDEDPHLFGESVDQVIGGAVQ